MVVLLAFPACSVFVGGLSADVVVLVGVACVVSVDQVAKTACQRVS